MTPLLWPQLQKHATLSAPNYALLQGDARSTLKRLPAASVDTCVTSPPYWAVRDYGVDGQIGVESQLDSYVDNIVAVFDEMHRVLKDSGSIWLNVGDKYLNGVGTVNGLPPERGWKRNKQLALVPFRIAIALEERGWWVRNTLVWHKPNGMPISATDRLANHWEPVFLITKSERYFFDLDGIREPHKTDDSVERRRAENGENRGATMGADHLRKWLNSPRHRANIEGLKDIERRPNAPEAVELAAYMRGAMMRKGMSIQDVADALRQPFERTRHYLRTDRMGSRLPPHETWVELKNILGLDSSYDEAMSVEVGDNAFRNHPNGRNPGDVRSIGIGPNDTGHLATMPYRLAEWCLKATLPKNGICLDPFMGSGTTGVAALALGGRFVGVDISEEYVALAHDRLGGARPKGIAAE
jgi:DNA modification methylase